MRAFFAINITELNLQITNLHPKTANETKPMTFTNYFMTMLRYSTLSIIQSFDNINYICMVN